MKEKIKLSNFPPSENSSFWCFKCGKETSKDICFFSCMINGHMGSMIYCRACFETTTKHPLNVTKELLN